jgi:hypothetical protein
VSATPELAGTGDRGGDALGGLLAGLLGGGLGPLDALGCLRPCDPDLLSGLAADLGGFLDGAGLRRSLF